MRSAFFHSHFYKSLSALTRQSHTGQKFSEKIFFKGLQLYFETSLLSFIGLHKIFTYIYTTVYLLRIWSYKNADEKAHSVYFLFFKKKQKRRKSAKKWIRGKFTL